MKLPLSMPLLGLLMGALPQISHAHDLGAEDAHPHPSTALNPASSFISPEWFLAQNSTASPAGSREPSRAGESKPNQAAVFGAFAPAVQTRWDARFLYVESNGMPAHPMMIGITSWQQQVPIPQSYTGDNAWRIPLLPVPAANPVSIKGRFLRGAIALAANGIPIFNPQNNRGEVSAEIGELDQWGGHCGRADDYHYHAAPLHLQRTVGAGRPIAYALDGYPILGLTEADGSAPSGLDAFNGHAVRGGEYHYHASTKYPYVNGGFHGEVVEKDGQVDPQPRAQPVREALRALRGAKITTFETGANQTTKVGYELDGEKRAVLYARNADGTYTFEFQNGKEGTSRQTFSPKAGGGGGGRGDEPGSKGPPRNDGRPDPSGKGAPEKRPGGRNAEAPAPAKPLETPSTAANPLPRFTGFTLRSSAVRDGGPLPPEYSGDGVGSTLPLEWTGAPEGTKSYALAMHHLDPEGKTKWYWILYNLDPGVRSLEKNTKGVGTLGTNFKGQFAYEPPHSKGPGAKTYTLTLYALSAPLNAQAGVKMDYEALTNAVRGKVLAAADLNVVYTRPAGAAETPPPNNGSRPPRGPGGGPNPPPPPPR